MILSKQQIDNILAAMPMSVQQETVLDNIAETIAGGELDFETLQTHGLDYSLQQVLKQKIEEQRVVLKEKEESELWDKCDEENTVQAYDEYLSKFPNGKHADRARRNKDRLIIDDNKHLYIDEIKQNINAYAPDELAEKNITLNDILNAGITIPNVIQNIWGKERISLQFGDKTAAIPSGRTEIYFWGTTSSGKTCTLAALLSRAKDLGLIQFLGGNGRLYMTQLSNIFKDGTAILPPGTSTGKNQALLCNLRDKQKNEHPLALIEIAGEIYKCFSRSVNNQHIKPEYKPAHDDLLEYLNSSNNPKYHFFIIDVSNDKIDKDGLSQIDYLTDAATYFSENNIFNNKTAGISIIITKSDLLGNTEKEKGEQAIALLKKKYLNFVESLRSIAYKHKLIAKQSDMLDVYPFSIGTVYFKEMCIFNPQPSDKIISILQNNIAKTDTGNRWEFFNR